MLFKELINIFIVPIEYTIDFLRLFRWSKASPLCPKDKHLHYDILLLAHTIEKGLSSSNPREKFGKDKIIKLLGFLDKYRIQWGRFPIEKSYGCLLAYVDWHAQKKIDLGEIGVRIGEFLRKCEKLNIKPKGGVRSISNSSITTNVEVEIFLKERFSCRRFKPQLVSKDELMRIFEIARRTPSQCNRQSGRIHFYSKTEDINHLLTLQAGANEFRESVYNLFVITSELSAWSGFKARSQAYVDGALLAMQVLNACQSLGLGACPLNLAVSNYKELQICKAGRIPVSQRLIMMIAFGYPNSSATDLIVARSERLGFEDLFINH